jgi:DNA-binding response OmpR family regulator
MKILVIDDDVMLLRTISKILIGDGHEVITAAEGSRGMVLFRLKNPDMVITDIVMPQQEGLETILTLRRDNNPIKIIVMSGCDNEMLETARLIGADAAIEKPFRAEELLSQVRALCAPAA